MRRMFLLVFCALFLAAPVLARQQTPSLETTSCPFEAPDGEVEGQTMECDTLTVPEDYSQPDGQQIELQVAIIYSTNPEPEPDPVLYLSGGPGDSAVSDIDSWLTYPMREKRDVILLDQRGTGFSVPSIDCPDDVGDDVTQNCHDDWVGQGVNLSAYNSINSANDVAALREALGIDEWNLLGISYGTRLSLVIMRDHPEGVRSVILDSTYPPQVNDWEEVSGDEVQSFSTLFAGCAADSACNAAFPDLESVFYQTVADLNANPATYEGSDAEGNVTEIDLDGDTLVQDLYLALYVTSNIPYLPAALYAASQGDYTLLDEVNSGAVGGEKSRLRQDDGGELPDGDAGGLYNSITCSEELPFVDEDKARANAESTREEVRDGMVGGLESIYVTCRIWDVQPAPAIEAEAVSSDIPTLVLAGEYDPATPAAWGRMAADTLSNSFFFEFPGVGHATIDGGECPQSIILQFLDDPTSEPDGSCIDAMGAPQFVTNP